MRIVKQQRRGGIVSDDLSLDRDVADQGVTKAVQVVSTEAATGQQQGRRTHQHIHPGEFLRDRIVLDVEHVCQSLSLLTAVATLSSSELSVRPACWAAVRLTSKRTFFPSRTNWIMPPRLTNCDISLTVKTAFLSRSTIILLSRLSSVRLRKRIWQSPDSSALEIRLATTVLPPIVSPASVASRLGPKGSCPRTQTVKEPPWAAATFPGHSINRPKL